MNDLRTAAQKVLERLRRYHYGNGFAEDAECIADLEAALAQQAEPVQDQDVEDAIEAAYWQFDCRKKGLNEWASAPQSERDAFKAEARKLVRGYFPTRQAQDTKREMLAVADAFIRGKRAALAQQAEPVAADALTEPKSGDKWRVEWWNESCRMMLPAHAKLDSFVAYKNGTIQFTIKRTAA